MERQVTGVIESGLKDVKGLKQTSSTSANSFSNVVVSLDESVDLDTAIQDVQSKIQAIRASLPNDVEAPQVKTFQTSGPSFIMGITTKSGDISTIRDQALSVIKEVSDVDGVKSAKLFNDIEDRVTIRFSTEALTKNGVALQTLQLALQGANLNFPVGNLELDGKKSSIVAFGSFTNLQDIQSLVVGVNPSNGRPVTVDDIADVRRGYASDATIDRFSIQENGQLITRPGVLIAIDVTADGDVIRVREALMKHLDEKRNEGQLSSATETYLLDDQAKATSSQIEEILHGALGAPNNFFLLGGIQLLFVAMLLFVNWRAALVAALSIPISLLFTFLILGILGIQLNTIVLFSLILVLGLIVDPAIVMVEAIQRYRDLKYGKEEAVLESGRRYGASLFMAVLTSVIVFVPFGVVSGIFGQIIKYIPLTVVPALFASYLVPVAFLPLFSKYVIQTHKPAHENDGKAHEVEGLTGAAEWFMRLNRTILSSRWKQVVTLLVGFLLVGASLGIVGAGKVQTVQFSKPNDNQFITVNVTLAKGLTVADRNAVGLALEKILRTESGIDHSFYYTQSSSEFLIWNELKPRADRGDGQGSKDIVARLKPQVAAVKNTTDYIVAEVGSGTPDPDFQISAQLYDNDPAVLEAAAKDLGAFLAKQPKVIKVDDGFTNRGEPEVRLELDRAKVQRLGLSSFEIGQQLKAITDETKVGKFTGTAEPATIYLQNEKLPTTTEALKQIPVVTRTGAVVRVGDVATVKRDVTVDTIQRFDGQRYVNIRARVDGNNTDVFAVQRAFNEYVTKDKLKELGIDSNESRGEFDDIAKSFSELGIALVVAILLTYIVLVLQFKSFSQPIVMLVTVPLSFIGVFPALWATGSDLGFLELLGITILVGIVENVAIFLMDYANQLVRTEGITPKEAIIRATGVRFRPILLTKLVALGGLLPLAIESEFWRGLAVTIIAGIGLSGFFSLVVIPILYVWIEKMRAKVHSRAT
jgi:HAE1 family hydrophobic/amphiphilic exporter-1